MTITEPLAPTARSPRTGWRARLDRPAMIAASLALAGFAYRVWLIANDLPPTNSDEATMGLAALHIAAGSDFPVFFYGQAYMGTLEAYLAVPLFWLLGASTTVLRLPPPPSPPGADNYKEVATRARQGDNIRVAVFRSCLRTTMRPLPDAAARRRATTAAGGETQRGPRT